MWMVYRRGAFFSSTHAYCVFACNNAIYAPDVSLCQVSIGLNQGCTNRCSLAAGLRRNEERMRKWRGSEERMRKWREIHSLHFLILSLFPPSLSISSIKICHILSQNINYGTFVTNGTKNLTYALWGNNSGSNLLHTRKLRKLCQPGSQHKFLGLWCHIMLSSEKGKTRSPNNDQVDTILFFYKGFILPTADNEKLIPGL